MNVFAVVFAAVLLIGTAAAGRPHLSICVRDGNFDGLDGLDPILTWENMQKAGDLDVSYGVEATARPTSDIASLPRNIWGKVRADISGWGMSVRADIDGQDMTNADLEIGAENENVDLDVKLFANAGGDGGGGGGFTVRSVQATKGFGSMIRTSKTSRFSNSGGAARFTVTPRVDLENDLRDVEIRYSNGIVNLKLTASSNGSRDAEINYRMDATDLRLTANANGRPQQVRISQKIDASNRVAPTIDSNGDVSVEWERRLSYDSKFTAKLKPNDSLHVVWKDRSWTANVTMPVDGTDINGASVSIKRDVSF